MESLMDLPNIGKVLNEQLKRIGIEHAEDLREVGSKKAFSMLRTLKSSDRFYCIQMLYSLEGAIENVPYNKISSQKKNDLLEFFRQTNQ